MPDISEFPNYSLDEWQKWFSNTAKLIIDKTHEDDVTLFFQSDIKYQGKWIDKSYLIQKAAEESKTYLLWHKIACRAPVDVTSFGRPSYSHILCFSKNYRLNDLSVSTADVIGDLGKKTWQRGMGFNACKMIAKFVHNQVKSHTLINPFCGEGSMISMANYIGLNSIGIEKSKKRATKAQNINVIAKLKDWKV